MILSGQDTPSDTARSLQAGLFSAARSASPTLEQTLVSAAVVGAALGLGLLGDALLRATPWGVNAFLWFAALTAAATLLLRWRTTGATNP